MIVQACPGCHGKYPTGNGPTHDYMLSSPGCWSAYGALLEREYADPTLFARCHRLTVDAYALQHPGRIDERRAVRSVWLHFLSLHVIFARGASHQVANRLLRDTTARALPERPAAPDFAMTLADFTFADHAADVEGWSRSSYSSWAPLLAREADLLLG